MIELPKRPPQAVAAVQVKSIKLASDGTIEGTTLTINGEAIADLRSVSIYSWNDGESRYFGCSYSVGDERDDVQPGQMRETHNYTFMGECQSGCASARACVNKEATTEQLRKAYGTVFGAGERQISRIK